MKQVAFDFGREDRLERGERELVDALRDAVSAIGLTRAAGACGARKQDLADALNGREGRHVRIGWAFRIADEAGGEHAFRILAAIAGPLGYAVAPFQPLTPEERAGRLEAALRSLGPVGVQALAEAIGGRR